MGETTAIDRATCALEEHLSGCGLGEEAISRLIQEDLRFLTSWEIEADPAEELEKATAVIAFAFGFGPPRDGVGYPPEQYHPLLHKPGKANEALAEVIRPFAETGLAVFAQWEVAEALKTLGIRVPDSQVARPAREYLGTGGVVRQFLESGLRQHEVVIVAAHPHHAFRCREITRTVCGKADPPHPVHVRIADTSGVPYDPESVQPWTRSPADWVRYEVATRFHGRFQGNME